MSLVQQKQSSFLNNLRFLPFLLFITLTAGAQEYQQRRESFDIKRYSIEIEVNDTTNAIKGATEIEVMLKKPVNEIFLDFISLKSNGNGMVVDSVVKNGSKLRFLHENNILKLPVYDHDSHNDHVFKVYYKGIAEDGLIISDNMYGERTFFADNWPNRARNWFPCLDHPSFRAKANFTITAPSHYQVIATGNLRRKVNLPGKKTTHYWFSDVPIPTKVMVFAAAGFAVEYMQDIDSIPWSNWVYPGNIEEGLSSFSATPSILRYFSDKIAPYPFEKIANVQSTTRYGGMENAGNIFYNERSVAGEESIENLIVHEMAHQWFGNSVSEREWAHLWLSEGVATWLTDRYILRKQGGKEFNDRMLSHRERIIGYSKTRLAPVVDHHPEDYTDLLNPNSYQKGSWVLHMLTRKIGEEQVVRGLAEYYDRYRLGSAATEDLIEVFEEVSGTDLGLFSDDWLYSAGHPVLTMNTSFSGKYLNMELIQNQQHKMAFTFPLDIRFIFSDGREIDHTFNIVFRRHEFVIEVPSEPVEIILDPNTWLLFEFQ